MLLNKRIKVAVEELCQNLLVSGPNLSLRRKAEKLAGEEIVIDGNNFNVLESHAGEYSRDSNEESSQSHTTHNTTSSSSSSYKRTSHDIRRMEYRISLFN
jgi:hypothetical protein